MRGVAWFMASDWRLGAGGRECRAPYAKQAYEGGEHAVRRSRAALCEELRQVSKSGCFNEVDCDSSHRKGFPATARH